LVDSADGISATMIEGYYRYTPKDQGKFFRYALSSAKETSLWWWRANNRKLISSTERYELVRKKLDDLIPQTLNFIKSLKT
jgi:four helix bundle protein